MGNYYRFTEDNDWEGETWNFYIQMTPEQRDKLWQLIDGVPMYELRDDKEYTEEEVDILVDNGRTGYLPSENKLGPLKELPESIDWDNDDPFYKGEIEGYCEEVKT